MVREVIGEMRVHTAELLHNLSRSYIHLRPKCVPCLLSPITHLLFVIWSLSFCLSFFSSLHKSFSQPLSLSDLFPFVLHNFFLSFDRCQCDSIRFTCDGTRPVHAFCMHRHVRLAGVLNATEHTQTYAYNVFNLGATMNGKTWSRDAVGSTWTLLCLCSSRITCIQLLKII